MALETCTVNVHAEDAAGTDGEGHVEFLLSTTLLDGAGDVVVTPNRIVVDLDENGDASVVLAANNFPGVQPTGSTYLTTLRVSNGSHRVVVQKRVSLDYQVDPVDLSDLLPVDVEEIVYGTPLAANVLVDDDGFTVLTGTRAQDVLDSADDALAAEATSRADADATLTSSIGTKVSKAGDTMTGPLTLPGDAAAALQATPLQQVQALIAALVDSSPAALDTLNELAAALGDDANFAATVTAALAEKETPAGAQAKVDAHGGARRWMSAQEFMLASGSAALSSTATGSSWPGWLFDAAASETVNGVVEIPPGWATFDIDLWWSNAGAGAGDVVWRLRMNQSGDGDTTVIGGNGALSTVTAPLQSVVKVTTVEAGVARTDDLIKIQVIRVSTDAGDTLANDASLIGVMLRKVS